MNEGQIYRAEEIHKAIEEIEKIVIKSELNIVVDEVIMSNVQIIKHHAVALFCDKTE